MKNFVALSAVVAFAGAANANVIVTGIMDGDLSGGTPKAIELYVDGTQDFTGWTLERSANGGSFGTSTDLSSLGIVSDAFVYLIGSGFSGEAQFDSVFGNAGDFANRLVSGNVSGNGDDGFRVLDASSVVIDQVWTEDTNDAYKDSFMYRMDGTGPDGGWNPANWMIPGNGVLDGLDAAGHAAAVPFGTYVVPAPGALALVGFAGLTATRRRRA